MLSTESSLHHFLSFPSSSQGTEGAGMKKPFMEWKAKKATQLQVSWRQQEMECDPPLIKWSRQLPLETEFAFQPSWFQHHCRQSHLRAVTELCLQAKWKVITAVHLLLNLTEVLFLLFLFFEFLLFNSQEAWHVEIALSLGSIVLDTSPGSTYF